MSQLINENISEIVRVENLVKKYVNLTALDNFSFTADRGKILAIVGPDGAGKTSLFRSLCSLIEFDAGEIIINGFNLKTGFEKIKPLLGYMPQIFSLYQDLSVEENLSFYAGLFGIKKEQLEQKKKELYRFSGLEPFAKRRASALSGGMKQKLALSCNLIHDPKILLLDEPTTGVDPLSRRQFWEILKNLRNSGSTIIVSTPYMDEVALSDKTIFVYQGRKLAEGTPSQLAGMYEGDVYYSEIFPSADLMRSINDIKGLSSRRFGSSIHLYIERDRSITNFQSSLKSCGLEIDSFKKIEPDIEDSFIQFMGKN